MQFTNVEYVEIVEWDIIIKLSTWVLIIDWEKPFITHVKGDWEIGLTQQEMKLVDDMCKRFEDEGLKYAKDKYLFINSI